MTITKAKVAGIAYAAGNCAAGTTKASPGVNSGWIDLTGKDGVDLGYRIVNGSSAPGTAPTLVIQESPDNGTTVYDYAAVGGDTTASSDNSGTIWIDRAVMYARVIAYGNTTNAVGIGADFSTVAG